MTTTPPTAFVSHATKDQGRFVRDFATRLREKGGVDAWYAEWELAPGDSLVSRIFEGINAQAFIVVLSDNSVNSKWVQEEMDAAFVRKVEGECRFIPVRLDKVEVPSQLRHIVWIDIDDLNNYDKAFDKIRDIIFGVRTKPSVGPGPAYAVQSIMAVPGLSKLDSFLLTQVFECQRDPQRLIPNTEPIVKAALEKGWSQSSIAESFKSLSEENYLDARYSLNRSNLPSIASLSPLGWEVMFRATKEDYAFTLKALAVHLVSHADDYQGKGDDSLTVVVGGDEQFAKHLVNSLKRQNYIDLREAGGGSYYVTDVKARLRRAVEDGRFD